MAQQPMYPAMVNSPITELSSGITDSQDSIPLVNAGVLPAGPNMATIGVGDAAETILYTAKGGNSLTGVTRGFQGTARAWAKGIKVARRITAYDHDTFQQNIVDHRSDYTMHKRKVSGSLPIHTIIRIAEIPQDANYGNIYGLFQYTSKYENVSAPRTVTITFAFAKSRFGTPRIVVLNQEFTSGSLGYLLMRTVFNNTTNEGSTMGIEVSYTGGPGVGATYELIQLEGNTEWDFITPVEGSVPSGYTSKLSDGATLVSGGSSAARQQSIGWTHLQNLFTERIVIQKAGSLLGDYFDTSYPWIIWSTANPEGGSSAPPGSLCLAMDGGVYKKTTGTGNTGWTTI